MPGRFSYWGTKRAFVVHGHDGLDEISVCAPTRVCELNDNRISTYDIMPEQFFDERAEPEALAGGAPVENAAITRRILNGETGPRRNVVLINAAAALTAAGKSENLKDGIQLAASSIDSGAAMKKLNDLIAFTQENDAVICRDFLSQITAYRGSCSPDKKNIARRPACGRMRKLR